MSAYTVTLDAIDLTPRHIGRMAMFSSKRGDQRRLHEGRINNIRFDVDHILCGSGEVVRDIISASVLIGDEWYPLSHVRLAETGEHWGMGNA